MKAPQNSDQTGSGDENCCGDAKCIDENSYDDNITDEKSCGDDSSTDDTYGSNNRVVQDVAQVEFELKQYFLIMGTFLVEYHALIIT